MRHRPTVAGYVAGKAPWRAVLIWIALSAGAIASLDMLLFREVVYETQDAAANSLQIRRAKQFQEFEGNYSRWGFHHPGPAFFYLFALGEAVFRDATGITASPHAAHVLTNVLFQCACYAYGIDVVARRSRRRWFLPLALLIWVLHFSTIRFANLGTVAHVWPPHILGGPLFLFLVSLATFAAGSSKAAPLVIFLGGILVHSHVGQTLLVVPLFLVATGSYWRTRGDFTEAMPESPPGKSQELRHFLWAGTFLLLFLMPMAVEFLSRPDNNFVRYLNTRPTTSTPRSWKTATAYLGTFFLYDQRVGDNEYLDAPRAELLRHRTCLGFALLGAAVLGVVYRLRSESAAIPSTDQVAAQSQDLRFWRRLLLLVFSACVLTLCWARFQPGRLYYFNTYYAGSLTVIVLYIVLYGCLPKADACPLRDRCESGLTAGAVVLCGSLGFVPDAWQRDYTWPPVGNDHHFERNIGPEVAGILARHPPENRPVVVRFPVWKWDESTSLVLELDRRGIVALVDPSWESTFGRTRVWRAEEFPAPVFWILSGETDKLEAPDALDFMRSAVIVQQNDTNDPRWKEPIRD